MHEHYTHPIDPIDQARHMYAMSFIRDLDIAAQLREMCLSEIRTQDAPGVLRVLLGGTATGPSTWDFIARHWQQLRDLYPTHGVPGMLGGIPRLADIDEDGNPILAHAVKAFLLEHPFGGHQRTIDQHLERLAVNVGFVREQRPTLGELLGKS
jgi:hypothetical protein